MAGSHHGDRMIPPDAAADSRGAVRGLRAGAHPAPRGRHVGPGCTPGRPRPTGAHLRVRSSARGPLHSQQGHPGPGARVASVPPGGVRAARSRAGGGRQASSQPWGGAAAGMAP